MSTVWGKPQMSVKLHNTYVELDNTRAERIAWVVSAGKARPAHCRYGGWQFTESCEEISVRTLSRFLGLKPFQVVAVLLDLGVLVHADRTVPLETAFTLLQRYGYTAERT